MASQYNEISDLLNGEATLPINWNASGKMSMSKLGGSNETLINFQDGDGFFRGTSSPLNNNRFNNDDVEKTPKRMAFSSMPDLSTSHDALPPPRGGARPMAGSVASTTALGGRTTPSSSTGGNKYTLKEYEQQLDKLQKENFNLKLRIWRLEEEYRRKGGITDDVAQRELEGQISELHTKLEEKERMMKESLDVLNQLKASGHRQVADLRREHEAEMEVVRRKFADRVNALEELLQTTNEQMQTLQNENEQLSKLVSMETRNPSLGFESDSDISLLSQREREVFDLKARVAILERVLQSTSSASQFEEEASGLRTKQSENASSFGGQTLRHDEMDLEALRLEVADKNEIIAKMQSQIKETEEFISRVREGVEGADERIDELESEMREKNEYIVTLESNMEEKNQLIARLDSEVDRCKARLENIVQNQRTHSNNSDDEKVRQLESELNNERANSLKSAKIIQGLLKQITNERKSTRPRVDSSAVVQTGASLFHTPPSDTGGGDRGNGENEHDLDYSATFIAWLNETAGVHIRQHDDLFRRQIAELQTARETLYDRLKRVADNLEEYGRRLAVGVDAQHILSALSGDLSVLRQDLQDSLLQATYSIAAALANGDNSKGELSAAIADRQVFNGLGGAINDSFGQVVQEQHSISHANVSNLSRLSAGEILLHDRSAGMDIPLTLLNKSAQTDPMSPIIASAEPTVASSVTVANTVAAPDSSTVDKLHRRCNELSQQYEQLRGKFEEARVLKDKYERYAKKAKAKYRELLKAPVIGNVEGSIDELLTGYQQMEELVESVVRQLEENNKVLGQQFEDHEHHDKKLKEAVKRETAKAKELKRRLRASEVKE